jgi:hypothetical protein
MLSRREGFQMKIFVLFRALLRQSSFCKSGLHVRLVSFGYWLAVLCLLCAFTFEALAAEPTIVYRNDFQTNQAGKLPEDMLVLDGNFSIKSEGTNKFLQLPGAPLDTFSVQFGPVETNPSSVSALIRSTAKGRRAPSFGVGLYGVAGFRLQVSAAKQSLEILKDQTSFASVPFDWKSGEWTVLRLQARALPHSMWKIEGKAWTKGQPEPPAFQVSAEYKADSPLTGRCSVFGSPFAGTPIQFDDLEISSK